MSTETKIDHVHVFNQARILLSAYIVDMIERNAPIEASLIERVDAVCEQLDRLEEQLNKSTN